MPLSTVEEKTFLARRILKQSEQDVANCIGYKCLLQSARENKTLLDNLNETPVTTCFSMTMSACVQALMMALMRMWDTAGSDRLSIGRLDKVCLKDADFLQDCITRAEKEWCNKPQTNRSNAERLVQEIEVYLKDDSLYKELKQIRDNTIAHSLDMSSPEITFERLFEIADETVKIFNELNLFITGVSSSYDFMEEDFKLQSDRYWKMMADGAKKYDDDKKETIAALYR